MLEFIHGKPIPQARPRFARRGRKVITYDPSQCRRWKNEIKRQIMINNLARICTKPIEITLRFYFNSPANNKSLHHTKKPDLDNLVKAVLDALKGIYYHDDSIVVNIHAGKNYVIDSFGREGVY